MADQFIKINDIEFNKSVGNPIVFQGKHSRGNLSGIDLDFSISNQNNIEEVEELLNHSEVQVEDPFANRSYIATIHRQSYSYQHGRPERHYVLQIRELDLPPEFDVLEIEEQKFPVLKYRETDHEDDAIGMHALLKLSKEQFIQLQMLLDKDSVQIRRIGVDAVPITLRYGGAMYWSEHEEGREKYYKHIVRFFPLNLSPSRVNLASGVIQTTLAKKVYNLSARFEALLNELAQNKVISKEKRDILLEANLEELLDKNHLDEMFWEYDKTSDAEEEL